MVLKEAPELTFADAQPARQIINARLVERPELDQSQCPRDGIRGAAPSPEIRCRLGPAAQTGPETRFLGCRGGGIKRHIRRSRRAGRANWSAIDAGGFDAGEKPAIKTGVALAQRAIAGVMIEIHIPKMGGETHVV